MNTNRLDLHSCWRILVFSSLLIHSLGVINTDKTLLLSFKQSVLSDPLGVLSSWNSNDRSACSWNGISCGTPGMGNAYMRVVGLSLPNSQLLCSLPANLGTIQHLRILNLSNNSINGSVPLSLYNAFELQMLDLSGNLISGGLPELVGGLINLQSLNLSDNALSGKIPDNLTTLGNLTVVSLTNNFFYGSLPSGFQWVEVLDLSSNLINGSLPSNFASNNLRYFNVSYNRLSGEIPTEFANQIPTNATIDLSFNHFTGEIPQTSLFLNQKAESYSGNQALCGNPLNMCPFPSSVSTPPNDSASTTSTPAIAAIPNPTSPGKSNGSGRSMLTPAKIAGIVAGDLLGVAILASIILFVFKLRKKMNRVTNLKSTKADDWASSSSEETQGIRALACLRKQTNGDEESSETSSSDGEEIKESQKGHGNQMIGMVDGEKEMELETLLKASAYVLGATGSSIVYKAVLEDGTALAIRRIGESGVERFRDFENQVRVIAKMVHPNLVRIRGFYWGADEKLVLYDFVPNGSLANARYRKVGSSPCHLPWGVRLKIARGVARGLNYIHDKKHVHGNLKPSNILLGSDMEPKIGDFGLERLVVGESGYKAGGSNQNHSSRRSTASRDSFSFQDVTMGATPSPSSSSMGCISPYYAPESLRSLKPNTKWDVYSFGMVLLELLTGKVIVLDELGLGLAPEESNRVLRMCDVAIRAELEGKEDAVLALLKVGFNCILPVPHKRPSMKEVLQALEKFPSSSSSSCSYGPQ